MKYMVKCHIQKDGGYWDFTEWREYDANSISDAISSAQEEAFDNYACCEVLGVLSEEDYEQLKENQND